MRFLSRLQFLLFAAFWAAAPAWAEDAAEARARALAVWREGDFTNALAIVNAALVKAPDDDRLVNLRAHMHALRHEEAAALADFTRLVELAPEAASVRQERARVLFRLARFGDALRDFDAANRLEAKFAPFNWERGIALYFAGRYDEAREQFELHQTVNTNDVENAVWHFMCVTRTKDIGEARRRFITILGDERVPMTDIHRMFAGLATPEDVLDAATKGEVKPDARDDRAFNAHLYCGLFLELTGNNTRALEEFNAAAKLAAPEEFMAAVAKLSAAKLAAAAQSKPPPNADTPPSSAKTPDAK